METGEVQNRSIATMRLHEIYQTCTEARNTAQVSGDCVQLAGMFDVGLLNSQSIYVGITS
jgi:hypothetical protein